MDLKSESVEVLTEVLRGRSPENGNLEVLKLRTDNSDENLACQACFEKKIPPDPLVLVYYTVMVIELSQMV